MEQSQITQLTATQMRSRIAARELSPVTLIEACLAQIERHNGAINAVCTIAEDALEQAQKAEKKVASGESLPLLHGLPVGIKDVTPTAGMRTTFGSTLYKDHIPDEDALVVRRLKEAGAIILCKTNTPEFAAGGNTFNEVFGRTRNPWNRQLSAGGSTGGGAAALATGMIALAQGTDLGGSLRIPASFCGVVGLRPSVGLVPSYPSAFLWDSFQVDGPMARTAEDVALMLQAISGPDPLAPLCQPIDGRDFVAAVAKDITKGTRVGYCPDIAGIGVDPQVEKICREAAFALADAGVAVEEIEFDLAFARPAFLALRGLWMVTHHTIHLDKMEYLGSNVAGNIEAGLRVETRQLAEAENARSKMWQMFCEFFTKFDYLLTPCMAVPPFPVEENYPQTVAGKKMDTYVDWIAPTFVLSLTGLPVSSTPCGLTQEKLPVGMQIVGRPRGEETVLALARKIHRQNPIGLPLL